MLLSYRNWPINLHNKMLRHTQTIRQLKTDELVECVWSFCSPNQLNGFYLSVKLAWFGLKAIIHLCFVNYLLWKIGKSPWKSAMELNLF